MHRLILKLSFSLFLAGILILHHGHLYAKNVALPRIIIGLYDSSDRSVTGHDDNPIHKYAELPLNHLGFIVKFHDISSGLPDLSNAENIRGVLTWFNKQHPISAKEYVDWILLQIAEEKKVVVMEHPGITASEGDNSEVERLYKALGVKYKGSWTNNPLLINLKDYDDQIMGFEIDFKKNISVYEHFELMNYEEGEIYLSLERSDIPNSQSCLIAKTSAGGIASEGYVLFRNHWDGSARWILDPFKYFSSVFDAIHFPRLDITTLFGNRIFYSHIDGDGLRNISEIDNVSMSGEVVLEEIIRKYDLPVTTSFITAELIDEHYGSKETRDLARTILEENNVETGVHSFSHPLHWKELLTTFGIENYSRPLDSKIHQSIYYSTDYPHSYLIEVDHDEYIAREINGSVNFMNSHITPPDKPVRVYQWSGNCEPDQDTLKMTYDLGLLNINRGDGRLDQSSPTYTSIPPFVRQEGEYIQVHTSGSNENMYTNLWEGPYDGYAKVIETFQESENPNLVDGGPLRVLPINVYYHFYIGEKNLSLKSIQKVFDYVLDQSILPLYTSEFIRVVQGFMSAKISKASDNSLIIEDYGYCRTLRIHHSQGYPDMVLSQGVLGFKKWKDYIFIHLKEGDEVKIYLRDEPDSEPFLSDSSSMLRKVKISKTSLEFEIRLFKDNTVLFKNLVPDAMFESQIGKFKSRSNGDLLIDVKGSGWKKVRLKAQLNKGF